MIYFPIISYWGFTLIDTDETILDDKKHIVSIRINNSDRYAMRMTAERLCIRESELYRLAICHLLNKLHKLQDESCNGSDLLPLFLEFKEELNMHMGFKKQQLFKIFNINSTPPEKFVAMCDIELLLLPLHAVRQRLIMMNTSLEQKNTENWLVQYMKEKYGLEIQLKL
jgi:hypothetical protein